MNIFEKVASLAVALATMPDKGTKKLEEKLKQHEIWVLTNGKDGNRFTTTILHKLISETNLGGASLSKSALCGANLSRSDLSKSDFKGFNLSGANLTEANLTGSDFRDANLSKVYLVKANLSKASLNAANLSGSDLSGANFSGANLSDSNFRGANLSGANLSGANLSDSNFRGANLSGANNLSGADLSGADLSGANLSLTRLTGANLSKAFLLGVNLRGADLVGADLSGADLILARLSGVYLNGANLSESDLSGASLSSANLSGATLNGANLSGADLSKASLSKANLISTNLYGANLNGANLSYANLRLANLCRVQALKTNFTSAVLTGACIEDWNINDTTLLEEVECQDIYLKLDSSGKYTERRPSNENTNFAVGDFEKLVRKAQSTVDLIFRNGIDWQALAISLDKFKVESGDGELTIQAIENKGDGDFVVRVNVAPDADKSAIETLIKQEYELKVKEIDAMNQERLKFKDREIAIYLKQVSYERQNNIRLTGIIETMAEKESINNDLRGSNIGNFANTLQGNAQQQANQYNYSPEQKQNLAEAAVEIQQLLERLSATYPTTTISEKSVIVTKAVEAIEKNPAQKAKIIKAVKAGGIAALKELVEPVMKPITNILFPILEALSEE